MNKKKKFLIIGGNSGIGGSLREKLQKKKFEVYFTSKKKLVKNR
jgi:short-subunit dehydrogenase